MSKPRYDWDSNVVRAIGYYPELEKAKAAIQASSVTVGYSGDPRACGEKRGAENCALRQLSPREEEELEAIRKAIAYTERQKGGADIMKIVKMVDWKKSHDISGAGMVVNMSESTAKRERRKFITAVAVNMGYLKSWPNRAKKP